MLSCSLIALHSLEIQEKAKSQILVKQGNMMRLLDLKQIPQFETYPFERKANERKENILISQSKAFLFRK